MQRLCHAVSQFLARLSARLAAPEAALGADFDVPRASFADGLALALARVIATSGPALLLAPRRSLDEGAGVFAAMAAHLARRLLPDALVFGAAVLAFAVTLPRDRASVRPIAPAITVWSRWVAVLLLEALANAVRGTAPAGATHRAVQAIALLAAGASVVAIVRARRARAFRAAPAGRSTGALCVLAVFALAAVHVANAMPSLASPRGPARGAAAPDVVVPLLGGGTFRLGAARGRPVLIDFWATWCETCVESMPALETIAARRRGRVEVVAVEIEGAREKAERLAARERWAVPIGIGDPRLAERFGVRELPHLVLVDAEGRLALVFRGAYDPAAVGRALDALLDALRDGRPSEPPPRDRTSSAPP